MKSTECRGSARWNRALLLSDPNRRCGRIENAGNTKRDARWLVFSRQFWKFEIKNTPLWWERPCFCDWKLNILQRIHAYECRERMALFYKYSFLNIIITEKSSYIRVTLKIQSFCRTAAICICTESRLLSKARQWQQRLRFSQSQQVHGKAPLAVPLTVCNITV